MEAEERAAERKRLALEKSQKAYEATERAKKDGKAKKKTDGKDE